MKYFLIVFFLITTQAEAAKIRLFGEIYNGAVLTLVGDIKMGDEKKLMALVYPIQKRYEMDSRIVLVLNSRGGSLMGALRVGRILHHFGISTAIRKGAICYSACSMVFMAGWDKHNRKLYRIKHPAARLAVHHPYRRSSDGRLHKSPSEAMAIIKEYFDLTQAGDRMYDMTTKTPPRELRMIKNRELKRMGDYRIQTTLSWPEPRPFNTRPMMPNVKSEMAGRLVGGLSTFGVPVEQTYDNPVVIK